MPACSLCGWWFGESEAWPKNYAARSHLVFSYLYASNQTLCNPCVSPQCLRSRCSLAGHRPICRLDTGRYRCLPRWPSRARHECLRQGALRTHRIRHSKARFARIPSMVGRVLLFCALLAVQLIRATGCSSGLSPEVSLLAFGANSIISALIGGTGKLLKLNRNASAPGAGSFGWSRLSSAEKHELLVRRYLQYQLAQVRGPLACRLHLMRALLRAWPAVCSA